MHHGLPRHRLLFALATLAIVSPLLAGCAGSPWSPWSILKPWPSFNEKKPAPPASPPAAAPAQAAANKPDPQALQQVMAELQQLGTLDPAAREKLLADLKQSDPNLWPLMLQQVRATVAYRQQAEQREKAAAEEKAVALPPKGCAVLADAQTSGGTSAAAAPSVADSAPPAAKPIAAKASNDVAAAASSSHVVQAAYCAPLDWETHLTEAIRQLEAEQNTVPKTDSEIAQRAYLHMLYLLAGRRDDALSPIAGAPPAAQDFWSKQLYGLATWLDTDHTPDNARRAAETKRILGEAMARLGETAPLVVHNMAFCTEVQSYGSITPFKKADFTPDQEVLLYAEVENYLVQPTPRGFHTALRSSFQIFDSRGQRIVDHEFPATEEYCQSPRRDFFIGYHLRLPKRIYNGKHTLQLTIEDLQSHKVGQSSIDLTIHGSDE